MHYYDSVCMQLAYFLYKHQYLQIIKLNLLEPAVQ